LSSSIVKTLAFDAESEGVYSMTSSEIASRIAARFDEPGGNLSSFHWLLDHGVVVENKGSYELGSYLK
jgi:hypothetical protein